MSLSTLQRSTITTGADVAGPAAERVRAWHRSDGATAQLTSVGGGLASARCNEPPPPFQLELIHPCTRGPAVVRAD